MNVTVETIGPALASSYLEKNIANRPLRKQYVAHLSSLMRSGEFRQNGDPIRFNGSVLIDGQHKLSAIVDSGKEFEFVVVRGLGSDAFSTIDKGLHRKTSDTLQLEGFTNCKTLASSLRLVIAYSKNSRATNLSRSESWTDAQAVRWLNENPMLSKYVSAFESNGVRKCIRGIATGSMASALTFITSEGSGECQQDYWMSAFSGVGLQKDTGAFWLHHRLRSEAIEKRKSPQWLKLYLAIKSWNKDYSGISVKALYVSINEVLPRVKGFDRKFGNLVTGLK